jgi:hypothetical protein
MKFHFYTYILHAVKWRLHRLSCELLATIADRKLLYFCAKGLQMQILGLAALSNIRENRRIRECVSRVAPSRVSRTASRLKSACEVVRLTCQWKAPNVPIQRTNRGTRGRRDQFHATLPSPTITLVLTQWSKCLQAHWSHTDRCEEHPFSVIS